MPPCKVDNNLPLLQGFIIATIISATIFAIIGTQLQSTNLNNNSNKKDIPDIPGFLDYKGNYTTVLGYNIVIVGFLLAIVVILAINAQCHISLGFIEGTIYFLPIIATIGTIIYISALHSKYKEKLSHQLVNLDFYNYSTIFSIFSTIQILLACRYLKLLVNEPGSVNFFNVGVMILSVYNYFVLGKMYNILKYFSTDG